MTDKLATWRRENPEKVAAQRSMERDRAMLREALDELLVTWANEGKKPGWCIRWDAAKEKARAALAATEEKP